MLYVLNVKYRCIPDGYNQPDNKPDFHDTPLLHDLLPGQWWSGRLDAGSLRC